MSSATYIGRSAAATQQYKHKQAERRFHVEDSLVVPRVFWIRTIWYLSADKLY